MTRDEVKITEVCCRPIMMADDVAVSKLSDYEALQLEHRKALEALRQFAEGVRIVTRQMKQQHADDNDSIASTAASSSEGSQQQPLRSRTYSADSALSSVVSEDDKRLNDLSHVLHDALGADLLGLSQAAQMVNEHARLASQEASIVTDDYTRAGRTAQEAAERAQKAEKVAKALHRENKNLQKQLESLLVERRVLAKEVKSLRKENSSLKQMQQAYERQEALLVLEQHVRGALEMHEQQLAIATNRFHHEDASAEVDPEAETPATEQRSDEQVATRKQEGNVNVKDQEVEVPVDAEFVDVDEADAKPINVEVKNTKKAGFAGYGQKFNKKMKNLQVSTKRQVAPAPQISIETPTASTVATEESTPPKRDNVSKQTTNKENDANKHQRKPSGGGRNFLGELSTATSSFTSFFALSGPAMVNAARNRPSLSVDVVPPSITTSGKQTLLSPFGEDSTHETTSKRLMDAPCDSKVLRSLSIPQDTVSVEPLI